MKPKLLKIKGLNSFENEREINFDKLTSKGLFGIFGPTGSGKSTVLDAMTLALYGEISRASKIDKGFINVNSESAIVSLTFEIGEGNNRNIYKVERNISKDKKGGYKTKRTRLVLLDQDLIDKEVLAEKSTEVSKNVESILGLGLDDFTRSVVLPQGKFSEFLKLTGKDRRDMLERIFNLEKYGQNLIFKVRKKKKLYEDEKNRLEGELKSYDGVTNEVYEELKESIKVLSDREKELFKSREQQEKKFNEFKEVWTLQQELLNYEKELKILEQKKEENNLNKERLDKGEKASKLRIHIDNIKSCKENLEENYLNKESKRKEFENLEKSLNIEENIFVQSERAKEEEIPKLIKYIEVLNTVIKIDKDIKELEKERINYAKSWNEINSNITMKNKEKSLNQEILEKILENLKQNEEEIIKNKIDLNFREKIQLGVDKEKEKDNLLKFIDETNFELNKIKNNLLKYDEELKNNNIILQQKEKKLKDIKLTFETLKSPGNYNELREKEINLNNYENKLILLKDKIKAKKTLVIEINNCNKEKIEQERKINDIGKEKDKLLNKIENLKLKVEEMKDKSRASLLAKNLTEGKECPVCGSIHHIKLAKEIDENELNNKLIEVENNEKLLNEKDELLKNLELGLAKIKAFEENKKIQLNEYNDIDENINCELKLEEIQKQKDQLINLAKEINKYDQDKNNLNKKILDLTKETGNFNNVKVSLESKIEGDKKNKIKLLEKLNAYTKSFEEINKEYLNLKLELNVENFKEEIKEIYRKEKLIEKLQKENQIRNEEREKTEKLIGKIEEDINKFNLKKQDIETLGKAKKHEIDKKLQDYKEKYLGDNPEEDLKNAEKAIKDINDRYRERKEIFDNLNKQIIEVSKQLEALNKQRHTLESLKEDYSKKLNLALTETEFENLKEVEQYILDEETLENLKKHIKEFEDKFNIIADSIEKLKVKLNGNFIEEEEFKNFEYEFEKIKNSYSENHDLLINKNAEYKDMTLRIEKCKSILEKHSKILEKLELISQIDNSLKGNKFVEYVAKNQLKYIAKEASKRLREISMDKYDLEIDDEGNFVIVDNNNGGERRNTSTLSGGETFLASLALALSLSSQIQLKGSAPLEFFFLDEGFGTLDSELLDVVMSSLERLNSNKLSVGIISHVEELKQRIPVKLIVTPASPGEGGTKVKIEY